jgi:hypothetical protein
MPSHSSGQNRLWVQSLCTAVPAAKEAAPLAKEAVPIPTELAVEVITSSVGAIVKSAADLLSTPDQYGIKTVAAHDPGFIIRANATSASFLLNRITLNVGSEAIPIRHETTHEPLPLKDIKKSSEYKASPVVILLELTESGDGTALAAYVKDWKYAHFLDPSPAIGWFRNWLREPQRKVTVEVKISDVEDGVLWATAMQVEAEGSTLPDTRPNDGERLPWTKRPVKNFPGRREVDRDQTFGPVNIEASITEVVEPSRWAKILGTALGNQKSAIEEYVKSSITQALGKTEAAKANLASIEGASKARNTYQAAYQDAAKARKTFDDAAESDKSAAKLALELKLAILHQNEVLARTAFDGARVPFEPLPPIKRPA